LTGIWGVKLQDIFRLGRLFEPAVVTVKDHTTKRASVAGFHFLNPVSLASRNNEVKKKNDKQEGGGSYILDRDF
jgi:hypothetical protein